VPKTYEYQCEKHGPWTDFHSDRKATYDCPTCLVENQNHYAILYGRQITTTHLLMVANDSLTYTATARRLARQLADVVASNGIPAAQGWLEGWWYASGNSTDENNEAWKALRIILGTV
jgi:hypothetical protein